MSEGVLIELTKGKYAIVDPDDWYRTDAFNWHAAESRGLFYAKRYVINVEKPYMLPMQNFILGIKHGIIVDHINHNGLDNRKANLRVCSAQENSYNTKKKSNASTSKFKGVYFCRTHNRWKSEIRAKGVIYRLGYYKNEYEAYTAYVEAAKKHHGEFACFNTIRGD